MKSAQRTKPQHRCFNHATIQHPVLVQPRNLALPESDSKIWNSSHSALLKISDKKSNAKNNSAQSVALSNHFINQLKKRIIMLNKNNQNRIYGNTRL
jgi:hypothetical protein